MITDKDYDNFEEVTIGTLKDNIYDEVFDWITQLIEDKSKQDIFNAIISTIPDSILVELCNKLKEIGE